jgi:hypothetical protein
MAAGWRPLGDDALIATSAVDVFGPDPPLLGPWSSGYSAVVGQPTFHPGPLLFWVLGVPALLDWPAALELTAGLIGVASVMGTVALAHRRGGRALMFAVAIAIPLMLSSLPAEVYSDIWNPSAAVLPLMLLTFLAWSLACGEYRLLPLSVLVASFLPHCHLVFLAPAVALFGIGTGGLVLTLRLRGVSGRTPRRWAAAAAAVGLLCWSGPLIDQATNDPGNGRLIYRAIRADQPTVGWTQGGRAVVRSVGLVPWWLREPQAPIERIADLVVSPTAVATGSTLLILGVLAITMLTGIRRSRPDVWAAGAIALALCASMALVTASTPEQSAPTLGYTLRWASPMGMWVWLALGWSVATFVRPARRLSSSRPALTVAALVAVMAVAGLVAVGGELRHEPYDQMGKIAAGLDAAIPPGDTVRVDAASGDLLAWNVQAGIVYELRKSGRTVFAPAFTDYLGPEYRGIQYDRLVRVFVDMPPVGGRVIANLTVTEHPNPAGDPFAAKSPPQRTLAVTVKAAGG